MLLTIYDTEWPVLCSCAVKKLLTHSVTQLMSVHCIDVINVEMKIKNVKKRGENLKKTFINVG